jgi:hypothetical protein
MAGLLPVFCLVWMGLLFVAQALVNEELLNRDAGIDDELHCPLPNGYSILMVDVADAGSVYNTKARGSSTFLPESGDTIEGIRLLQVAGPYLWGATDSKLAERFEESGAIDSYFVLDTRTGHKTALPNVQALHTLAKQVGIPVELEPISRIYTRYRYSWFDAIALFLFLSGPLCGVFAIGKQIVTFRKNGA